MSIPSGNCIPFEWLQLNIQILEELGWAGKSSTGEQHPLLLAELCPEPSKGTRSHASTALHCCCTPATLHCCSIPASSALLHPCHPALLQPGQLYEPDTQQGLLCIAAALMPALHCCIIHASPACCNAPGPSCSPDSPRGSSAEWPQLLKWALLCSPTPSPLLPLFRQCTHLQSSFLEEREALNLC